jgi:hypothetical protein
MFRMPALLIAPLPVNAARLAQKLDPRPNTNRLKTAVGHRLHLDASGNRRLRYRLLPHLSHPFLST